MRKNQGLPADPKPGYGPAMSRRTLIAHMPREQGHQGRPATLDEYSAYAGEDERAGSGVQGAGGLEVSRGRGFYVEIDGPSHARGSRVMIDRPGQVRPMRAGAGL